MSKFIFTSESVTEGHPDKVCDMISDAILDACMEQDPMSRVACETTACTGFVLICGEITTKAKVDYENIARDTIREIGYTDPSMEFDDDTSTVLVRLDEQSADIAMGVDRALEARENKMTEEQLEAIGAGDQGMMFGYASNETDSYMPYPIDLAHKLSKKLTEVRKNGTLPYLRPDGKTQVSVEYDKNGKPCRLEAVVLSTQHTEDVSRTPSFSLIPQADSLSAVPRAMQASPAARSLSTPMVEWPATAAELFPERTAQRLTEVQLTQPDTLPRTWSQRDLRINSRFSSLMQSAWQSPLPFW